MKRGRVSRVSRVKVLHFTNTTVRAGVEEHLLTLLRGFDRSAFELFLVCPGVLADLFGSDVPSDVQVAQLGIRSPLEFGRTLELAKLIRRWRPDVVHSHMFQSSMVASPVAWFCGVPVIIETPHVRERWRERQAWIKRSFVTDRLVGRFVSRYIAVSEANARYLAGEKGVLPQKVAVIRNGVDLARFDPERRSPRELRKARGFAENDSLIVVMARLEPQKGHCVLLEALSQVAPKFPRLRVALLGDGILRAQLERAARSLGLERTIYFAGRQSDPEDWLAMADFTVLPSFYEGLPIAAIESLASATPVVATAVDGTPEVVVDGKTGLTVPPGDSSALAASICRLLGDRELRNTLGSAGRQWVASHFSQDEQVAKTQALYLDALNGSAVGAARGAATEKRLPSERTADSTAASTARWAG